MEQQTFDIETGMAVYGAASAADVATPHLDPVASRGEGTVVSDELYAEYNAAIGSLIVARQRYADACENQGAESWAAEQAQEYLTREVEHRDQVRERYDAAARHRPPGERNG